MFQTDRYNKIALKAINSKSQPGGAQTLTSDELLADPQPLTIDSNKEMETPDQAVQRLDYFPDNSTFDSQPAKPRRALSAYNLFFRHQREQIKKELAEASSLVDYRQQKNETHRGKILFAELARTVANRWKTIDQETRSRYGQIAAQDNSRYEQEMKQWKNFHSSSFLHQFEEDIVFHSVIKSSFHRNTVEQSSCNVQHCDIQVRQSNSLSCETTFTPQQLNNSFGESSSTPSKQCTAVSTSQPSVAQSQNDFVSTEKSSTAKEKLKYFALQEPLQYTLPGTEISGTDRLEILAQRLGDEILELLLQIFGKCSQQE